MHKKSKSGMIGIIITVIILVLLVAISNIQVSKFRYVESGLATLVMPIQNGMVYLKNKITKNNTFFTDISDLQSENERLKEENSKIQQELREFEVIKSDNKELREYLNLTEQYGEYRTKPAYVINKDFNNYSSTIVINVGENEGIKPNMAVISDQGLVRTCNFCNTKYS